MARYAARHVVAWCPDVPRLRVGGRGVRPGAAGAATAPGDSGDLVFPTVASTNSDPVPDDGTCYLVESTGSYESSIQPGYDAGNVLQPGDVITGLDATARR